MSDKTKIAWATASWNPIVGCSKISPGCANCYAEKMACRLARMNNGDYDEVTNGMGWTGFTRNITRTYAAPRQWRKPRRIFVCSMGDLFHETVERGTLSYLSGVFVDCPQHTFIVLTKRAERMQEFFNDVNPPPNVWVGVTVENDDVAEERVQALADTSGHVRWVSFEPLLSYIDFEYELFGFLDWAVIGCESGPKRRPCNIEWVRSLVQQCQTAGVAVFVKQLDINGRVSKDMSEWPEDLRVREYPKTGQVI